MQGVVPSRAPSLVSCTPFVYNALGKSYAFANSWDSGPTTACDSARLRDRHFLAASVTSQKVIHVHVIVNCTYFSSNSTFSMCFSLLNVLLFVEEQWVTNSSPIHSFSCSCLYGGCILYTHWMINVLQYQVLSGDIFTSKYVQFSLGHTRVGSLETLYIYS